MVMLVIMLDVIPVWLQLSVLRTLFKDTPIMALTATATRQVRTVSATTGCWPHPV
jgi:hypothetical protein